MMTKDEAMEYGRKHGCKFYVYNSYGGLHGGFRTREQAEAYMQECIEESKNDRMNPDITFHIEEK